MPNVKLQSLVDQVEAITGSLVVALQTFGNLETKSRETVEIITTSLEATRGSAETAGREVSTSLDGMQTRTTETTTAIEKDLSGVTNSVKTTGEKLGSILDEILDKSATVIDDIRASIENSTGPFVDELERVLDAVELGIIKVDDINNSLLNAKIGAKTLRELLTGFDLRKFENEVQSLTRAMEKGKADIGDVLDFLIKRGGELGKSFADWVKRAKEGNISIDAFRKAIKRLLEQFEEFGGDTSGIENLLSIVADLVENDSATS